MAPTNDKPYISKADERYASNKDGQKTIVIWNSAVSLSITEVRSVRFEVFKKLDRFGSVRSEDLFGSIRFGLKFSKNYFGSVRFGSVRFGKSILLIFI